MASTDSNRLEALKLNQKVRQLEEQIAELLGKEKPKARLEPEEQKDYIAFGSSQHAALLGLIPGAEAGTWQLEDPLAYSVRFGALATPEMLQIILNQKLAELNSKPIVHASAPTLWIPPDAMGVTRGIV